MPEAPTLQSSTLTDQEVKAILTFYQAFTDHKPDLLDEVCSPDWQDIPLAPGQGPGPSGLKEQITSVFLQAFPDMQIVVHEIFGSPGRAGVRASITGTHVGEVMGVRPPASQWESPCMNSHLKDGRLTHTWHLEDWFGMLNTIGAWPPPTATAGTSQR